MDISDRIAEILYKEYVYYTFNPSEDSWGFKVTYEEIRPSGQIYNWESVENFTDPESGWFREWGEIIYEIIGEDTSLQKGIMHSLQLKVYNGLDELNRVKV